MSEGKGKNYYEVSKVSLLISTSRKKFKEEFKTYDKKSADKLYYAISTDIIQAISDGNVKNFEKLIKLIEYIKGSGDKFLEDFRRSIEESFGSFNFIILACKYTQVSILEYVLNNLKTINLINSLIKLDDVDSDGHNAFYYAIRSGNCKLVELLVKKCSYEYFRVTEEEFSNLLSRSYEELKLKCIVLPEDMEVQVESLIIGYRFHADSENSKNKIIKISHEDIIRRIDLVIDNIKLLLQEYSTANLDDKFFYIARFITQNIHILKRQLKSTYSKLPWEEIEFCIVAFLNNKRKSKENWLLSCLTKSKPRFPPKRYHTVIFNFFLTKDKLFDYLKKFSDALEIEKCSICNSSVQELSVLPNIQREKLITLIVKNNPEFTELYDEYRHLRDTHSLEVINEYLNLASSTNPKNCEGQLIIIRALQVMGEYFKNTLESPKMSVIISDVLLSSLPPETRKQITTLRNSLSHAFSQSQRINLEEDADENFFTNLQQDIKIINRVVVNMLYQTRHQHIKTILQNIINCKNTNEARRVLETFDFDFDKWFTNNKVDDSQQIMEWIEELNGLISEDNIIGKSLLAELKQLISTEFISHETEIDWMSKMIIIQTKRECINKKYINDNTLRTLKYSSEQILTSVDYNMDAKNKKNIGTLCHKVFRSIQLKISFDDLIQAWGLISKILYKLGCDPHNMQWIEEFRDKLVDKKIDNFNNENGKSNDNQNDKKQNKIDSLNKSYNIKILALKKLIDQIEFSSYKNNKTLQVAVEMLVLDILSILNDSKNHILTDNQLFLDEYSPVLIGKNLRNHLAHGNDIVKVSPFDITIAVFLSAKEFIAKNIIGSNKEIGKVMQSNLINLMKKYEQDLNVIANQEEMFRTLEEGNLEKLKETLKKGADIHGKNIRSWTAIHFAAKGPSIDVVKFVIDQNVNLKLTNDSGENALHIAAQYGRKSAVELLIKSKFDINALDGSWYTAMHKAAENGHAEIVKILIQNKADTDIKNQLGYSPLNIAVLTNQKNIVEILLKQERHVDYHESNGGFTILHIAAEYGHTEIVKYLIKHNANVNAKTHQQATPLLNAAINGHLEVVKILISHGAKVHFASVNGVTALHNAVETNREEIVEFLLQHGADVNSTPSPIDNFAPINYAAKDGLVNMLKLLLKYNARVNISTTDGRTPLHYAAFHGQVDIIDILIKNKAIINAKNINNDTPLHYASSAGHYNAVEFLLKKGALHDVKNDLNLTPLHLAAIGDKKKCAQVLIENGANVHTKNSEGKTALHLSSENGHVDTTELLISKGADINAKDSYGFTPLYVAAGADEVKIVEVLINAGADVDILDNYGCSALDLSISKGHTEIVRYFIDNKVPIDNEKIKSKSLFDALNHNNQKIAKMLIENISIDVKGEEGIKLLRSAAQNNQIEIVKLLLKLGVSVNVGRGEALASAVLTGHKNVVHTLLNQGNMNINEKMENGSTLLHDAVIMNHKNIAEFLISKGANVNAVLSNGTSVLHIAASKGYFDIVKLLLDNGADSSLKGVQNSTALEMALLKDTHDHNESFKILFENRKIDVNYRFNNDEKWTLLHLSAETGSLKITEYLIEKGADMQLQNKPGSKPIHIAAREGHDHLVEYYLNKNIDMYDRGSGGWTLLHYAVIKNRKNIVTYLINKQFDVNVIDYKFQTPLHYASHFGFNDVAQILLNNGAVYDAVDIFKKKPLEMAGNSNISGVFECIDRLFTAVKQNNIDGVERCINKKVVINAVNVDKVTPLHYAAWKGFTEIAEILINNGARVNIFNKNGSTPLHFAAKFGHPEIAQLLLNNGAIFNAKTNKNNTPLKLATNPEIIKLLALINRSFINVENGNTSVISDLKNAGSLDTVKAVMNARNNDGKTLIVLAIHKKFSKVDNLKDILLGNGEKTISDVNKLLIHEKYQEALDLCNNLLQRKKKYLSSDDPGILEIEFQIAFIIYKQQKYQKALDILTNIYHKQKDILGSNDRNTLKTSCTMAMALHRLAKNDEALIVFEETYEKQRKILAADDNDLRTTQIQMGLVLMNLHKYEEALFFYNKALEIELKNGGLSNVLVIENNIAMVYNLQGKYIEAIDKYQKVYELRKKIFGPNHSDTLRAIFNKVGVLLQQAKYNDALPALKKLLISQNKALGPNHVDTLMTKLRIGDIYFHQHKIVDAMKIYTSIQQPLALIFGVDHPENKLLTVKMRNLEKTYQFLGGNILECCQSNESISEAVESKESIKALLSNGVDINFKDNNGLTFLHYAVNNQDENIVKFLLKSDASCCSLSSKGNTALHFAVMKNNKSIVCILLEHAKQVLKNSELHDFINAKTTGGGMTCMHVAAQKGFEHIVEILLNNGAIYNSSNYTESKTPYDLCDNNNIKQLLKLIDEFFGDARNGNDLLITKLKRFDVTKNITILNTRNIEGQTLINVALSNNHKNLARKLLRILQNPH